MMRRKMTTIKTLFLLMLALLMFLSQASAEGLFPSMNQLFGTAMPSIGVALSRNADEIVEHADSKYEAYSAFSYDDYTAFGAYLAGVDAGLESTDMTDSTITVTITVNGASMQFVYDWKAQTATAIYPSGTRPETEKASVKVKASILPPVGGIMPSAQFAVGRSPDNENTTEDGITQTWNNFNDEDYSAFSTYLAQTGATMLQSKAEAGILTAEIGLNDSSFTFTYDWHTKTAQVFYPNGTFPESEKWNTLNGQGSILPQMDTIGKELPSVSQALSRLPDITEILEDGGWKETFNSFDETDYTAFSQYLQTTGCAVDEYHVEDGSVMVIQLSNLSGTFTFTYDTLRHIGTVAYPKGSRIEKAWAAATATPKPAATATRKPSQSNYSYSKYSESQCWSTAEQYFKNLSWKNPSSVTIHNHLTSYDESDNTYTFSIDYSAQNGFGGYNRNYYFITVSAATGKVTFAFGGN